VAGEGVDLGFEGVGEFGEEVGVDVEVADLAGGLEDGFGEVGEVGDLGRVGEERELGEDAAEGGAELVDGFGFGFGEYALEGLTQGGGVAGERVERGQHR
jgi:hypothetical protein